MPPEPVVTEFIGVYNADGGAIGEMKYVIGKFLGTAHCALCDITHSPVRRKPEWDAMTAQLGVPLTLLHLNQLPSDLAEATRAIGAPVVFARMADGQLAVALAPEELDSASGSVDEFATALASAVRRNGWTAE